MKNLLNWAMMVLVLNASVVAMESVQTERLDAGCQSIVVLPGLMSLNPLFGYDASNEGPLCKKQLVQIGMVATCKYQGMDRRFVFCRKACKKKSWFVVVNSSSSCDLKGELFDPSQSSEQLALEDVISGHQVIDTLDDVNVESRMTFVLDLLDIYVYKLIISILAPKDVWLYEWAEMVAVNLLQKLKSSSYYQNAAAYNIAARIAFDLVYKLNASMDAFFSNLDFQVQALHS
ncbi:MAG: hypothetical protein US49_C0002G0116 [candidate division TM6 bacterium GW2011_GWF2_37_49]|nr:MAG: hypothetical protein US49_C0002G0116 [candidate division TM6 bacterium GW2011_GWF2_37_49]